MTFGQISYGNIFFTLKNYVRFRKSSTLFILLRYYFVSETGVFDRTSAGQVKVSTSFKEIATFYYVSFIFHSDLDPYKVERRQDKGKYCFLHYFLALLNNVDIQLESSRVRTLLIAHIHLLCFDGSPLSGLSDFESPVNLKLHLRNGIQGCWGIYFM